MKSLMMFLGSVLLVGAAACSSSSSSSGSGFSCAAAGTKACPNDQATTQATADSCAKCTSQGQALYDCYSANGIPTTQSCDASGNDVDLTQDQQNTISSKCGSQFGAYLSCFAPATSGDGGT